MSFPARTRVWRSVPAAVVAAGLLIAGCSSGGTPSHGARPAASGRSQAAAPVKGPAGPAPTTLAGYYAQKLRWSPCHDGFQCARLLVPFDYNRPSWRRFSLPVIRLPASEPSQRIGSLVVNPGGPGGSGVQYALQARSQVSPAVRARFDVVGFDPRGVAGSVPAIRCLSDQQLDRYFATSDAPANAAQFANLVAQSKQFVRGCQAESGPLLPYVGTANAARDMDVLRGALGDPKLTYLGKSYGTYLGTWYAQLFPSRVRALVLDGAVDPAEPAFRMNVIQSQGFEVALRAFVTNCLHMSGCPFGHGSTVNQAIASIQGLINRAGRKPLASQVTGQPADSALLLNGVASALYSKSYWKYLRLGLGNAFAGNGTVLVELADALVERNQSGHYSNLIEAETAIDCIDRPWPRSLPAWRSAASSAAKAAPQFGEPIMWSSLPCAYWPVAAAKPVPMHANGAPPILVVGNTRDPATPFRDAKALASDLSSGVLLGWNGDGHTAYRMGSTCIDNAVDHYLINRVPPRDGTMCPAAG